MLDHAPTAETTLPEWIGVRAKLHGHRPAFTFVSDDGDRETTWTYGELWARASAVAQALRKVDRDVGEGADPTGDQRRALLLFPPGLEFMAGFLGCQIANWIPVPTCYPKPGRAMPRLNSAARDCAPGAIVCDRDTSNTIEETKLDPAARGLVRIETQTEWDRFSQTGDYDADVADPHGLALSPDSLALLQYTSGSTSEAKGVMVRHRNLMANLRAIQVGFGLRHYGETDDDYVRGAFWLPFYHDMGLIGGVLSILYLGGHAVLHSPRSFLQRPIRWLQLISDHRVSVSGAPNFAYQLCVDRIPPEQTDTLELKHWTTAFCGAEPILARTLSDFGNRFAACGFSESAFYPCYGLAEASLLVSGGDGPAIPNVIAVDRLALGAGKIQLANPSPKRGAPKQAMQNLVSCGRAAEGMEIAIVDPQSHRAVAERSIGEIWIRGTSVAAGYWNRNGETDNPFNAKMARGILARTVSSSAEATYFRTGDLGFFHEAELYVTGRLKDIVIVRGRNHYPQDIEASVREVIGDAAGQCAAFSVAAPRGESLAILAELPRHSNAWEMAELVRSIRREIIDVHEIDPRHVWLVRPATVPVTTSGKIKRSQCRELFHSGKLETRHRYDRASASEQTPIAIESLPHPAGPEDLVVVNTTLRAWLAEWLVARAGVEPNQVEIDRPFADYGLDSMTAVELSGELEDWTGIELTPIVAWNHPTIEKMSEFISVQLCLGGSALNESDETAELGNTQFATAHLQRD